MEIPTVPYQWSQKLAERDQSPVGGSDGGVSKKRVSMQTESLVQAQSGLIHLPKLNFLPCPLSV